jgi:hypothetical protein
MVNSTPTFVGQVPSGFGAITPSGEYIAYGSVTVPLSSGTGTIVLPNFTQIDAILRVDQNVQSSVTAHYTEAKIDSSTLNQIDVTSLLVTVSSGGWAVDSGTSELMYYAVIGH